jgi:hypothetical protein
MDINPNSKFEYLIGGFKLKPFIGVLWIAHGGDIGPIQLFGCDGEIMLMISKPQLFCS